MALLAGVGKRSTFPSHLLLKYKILDEWGYPYIQVTPNSWRIVWVESCANSLSNYCNIGKFFDSF